MPFFGAFGAAWDDAMVARWTEAGSRARDIGYRGELDPAVRAVGHPRGHSLEVGLAHAGTVDLRL